MREQAKKIDSLHLSGQALSTGEDSAPAARRWQNLSDSGPERTLAQDPGVAVIVGATGPAAHSCEEGLAQGQNFAY